VSGRTARRLRAGGIALCAIGALAHAGCLRPGAPQVARAVPKAPLSDDLPSDGGLSVSLRAVLVSGGSERPLAENETLHSGDHLYFQLRTSQPAYLYVVLFDPSGQPSVLFPVSGKGGQGRGPRVAARCPLRIPAEGTFYLQDPAGRQDLRVIASSEPLARADRRLCEQLQLACEDMGEQPLPRCPADTPRALFSSVKVATASPQGVASLRLLLRHDP
jgi:hypothetical protein